ncbi:MAG: hypothetical protein ACRDZO_11195 [Egibacteraceae bacterium]
MTSRAHWLIVLCLLVALLGQCAGPEDTAPVPPDVDTVTASSGCDPGAAR